MHEINVKQLDPVLQLLRQLTYDYRTNNPKLRAHIKELMGASAPLQVRYMLRHVATAHVTLITLVLTVRSLFTYPTP